MKNILKYITLYLLVIFSMANFCVLQAQFQQNSSRSLFSDFKAFKIDDAIMVFVIEDTQADNKSETRSGRGSSVGIGGNANLGQNGGSVSGGLSTNNDFRGQGQTNRQERIRARISARVTEVEPNGNLRIEGTRTTKINDETQTVRIRGVVRPVDVLADNSVYSYNIMDLQLFIEGDGIVTEVQKPGLITRFLRILF